MTNAPPQTLWSAPAILLMAPQMGENIGAAARVMANFGFDGLRVIAPRDGWPNEKAVAMASGANWILDHASVTPDLATASADLTHVFATAGRPRDIVKEVLGPREAAARMRDILAAGGRPGVLFGPERTGLETAEIIACDAIITYPVSPKHTSLNLAQAVGVFCYEWAVSSPDAAPPERWQLGAPEAATREELEGLIGQLFAELEAVNWFWPERKAPSMRDALRNAFTNAGFTGGDVRTLRGVVRALSNGPKRRTLDSRLDNARTLATDFLAAMTANDSPRLAALVTEDVAIDWPGLGAVTGSRALAAACSSSRPVGAVVRQMVVALDAVAVELVGPDGAAAVALIGLRDGRVASARYVGGAPSA